ncbi:WD40-repeat-containing domain protein [Thermoascus aurantiacus ATCC 26904]
MPSIAEDDDDRDLAGSQDGSSDNDMDDTMRDVDDGDGDEADVDVEPDPEPDSPSNTSQVSEGIGGASQQSAAPPISSPGANVVSDPISVFRPTVRPEALTATTYDIVPTTAAPHSTSINAVTATADMRWVFSGGSDGYVRKFNWVESINSKLMLTVAQRHPFVDSVIKAGVLMTYWENMDGNVLSPVYSLACHSQGLWILTGLESGNIRLQTVRHEEGKEIAVLQQHTSSVSVLTLTPDEKSLLSGSWDKKVLDWDLNVGQPRRVFGASAGQISAIQIRPESSIPVPQDTIEPPQPNGTYSSNNAAGSFGFMNGLDDGNQDISGAANAQAGSPADSLFGGTDSLFGDADGGAPSGDAFGVNEDDELSRALSNGAQHSEEDAHGEPDNLNQPNGVQDPNLPSIEPSTDAAAPDQGASSIAKDLPNGISEPAVNGLPHAEQLEPPSMTQDSFQPSQPETNIITDNVFLASSIDGTIRVWDRRQPDPVARISPRNVPPWCMNACWSPDGNYIYAGRRNGTVEEFSLHKGLKSPERVFKFPQGSGAVTALQAMPNGRHLVCASHDILRLYDLKHDESSRNAITPFLIIPGHRTGVISQLYLDPACRFMISTSGNRGWDGNTTEVLLGYEIAIP